MNRQLPVKEKIIKKGKLIENLKMSKLKRKVTVDADERRKPSVFERLGPGAVRRSYENYDDSDSDVSMLIRPASKFDMVISSTEMYTS